MKISLNIAKVEMSNKTLYKAISKGIDIGCKYEINNNVLTGLILLYDDKNNCFRYKI